MSAGFHRLGANAGKVVGWSNMRSPVQDAVVIATADIVQRKDGSLGPSISHAVPATSADHFSPGPAAALTQTEARQQGYTGDQCSKCNSMRMQMAGHCMVCADCGETTGCS